MMMETPPPAEATAEATVETTSEKPAETPAEATAKTTSEAPAETPAQTPVERVTKIKNPRKVAAGQKGAAAKKAKEEALLEQLRKAKDKIQPSPSSPPARAPTESPPKAEPSPWITYAVFAWALVAGALLLSAQKPEDAARAPAAEGKKADAVLNRNADPFYMS